MSHPEVLLTPLLMLTDYYLTLLCAVLKEKRYDACFKTEHFELNPMWRSDVAQKKWFNVRHLALTSLLSAALIWTVGYGGLPTEFIDCMLGALFVVYGLVIGRHLSNITFFVYINRRPSEISGQVTMSHPLVMALSMSHTLVVALPLIAVALSAPGPFVNGGLLGVVVFLIVHLFWLGRYTLRRKNVE